MVRSIAAKKSRLRAASACAPEGDMRKLELLFACMSNSTLKGIFILDKTLSVRNTCELWPLLDFRNHFPAKAMTFSMAAQVFWISSSVSVGWTKNITDVSPNSLATGNRGSGRQPVTSEQEP